MVHIRDITIRSKLVAIIMAACIASLLLAGTAFIGWEWYNLRQTLVGSVTTQAKMIAENSKAAVSFADVKDANDTLQSLKAEPSIVFGCLYGKDDEILISYYRTGVDANEVRPTGNRRSGYVFDDRYLTVFAPVVVDNEQVGVACLRSDLQPLYGMLKRDVSIIAAVVLVASFAAFFISSALQRIISGPILDLAGVAKIVSQKEQYSVRAKKHGNDEVGTLIDAFNVMLEQIQQRDAALVKVNTELEEKVQERTSELQEEVMVRRSAETALAETVRKVTMVNAELREFTRIAAHDMKTPLRAIGTLSDWISEDYAKKSYKEGEENARLLAGRAKRMSNLLDAVMAYSEIGLVDQREERVDLNGLVKGIIEETQCPDNVEITIEGRFPVVRGDRRFFAQVFTNLLSNAVKYIDKPKGLVRVGCVDRPDLWEFYVADNGCGIKERYFEKIFKIFQILAPRDETEEVGIGLAIVKKIVDMYEGRVWVKSKPGEGSTFYFSLPKERKRTTELILDNIDSFAQ
jgi:signal transduction histidine kinase